MSKELTPIYELLTWLGENRTKIENDGFWYVDVSCKMASMLSKESTFIRKKEREAASKAWDEGKDVILGGDNDGWQYVNCLTKE